MKSGFVSIIGRPNVGKSSFINKVINFDLSIVTSIPQTTRNKIKGIYNDKFSQIIFIDTPGIHKPKQKLGKNLNEKALSTIKDNDLILYFQPLNEKIGPGDEFIIEKIKKYNPIPVITKLDTGSSQEAQIRAKQLKKYNFSDVLGISIKIDNSIKHLINFIKDKIPNHVPYFENTELTDRSLNFLAKELIRKSVMLQTYHEIPHSIAVIINEFIELKDKIVIDAFIFVEKNSQKGIVIGKNGNKIKNIRIDSCKYLSNITSKKIKLKLKVKVRKNWKNDNKMIKIIDF